MLPVSFESGYISTHSLTRRLTPQTPFLLIRLHYFNSQPHEEADTDLTRLIQQMNYFNSQPHEEADIRMVCDRFWMDISTHSLTRRLTFGVFRCFI